MFSLKKQGKFSGREKKSHTGGALLLGMALGAAASAALIKLKDSKIKKCGLAKAVEGFCNDKSDSLCDCDCDCDCSDHERARNGFDCHEGHTEEGDIDILHSHGCLGYPHDDSFGFADSKGDRPNDLSVPQFAADQSEVRDSVLEVKNSKNKSNPQPENRVNEVKKKY